MNEIQQIFAILHDKLIIDHWNLEVSLIIVGLYLITVDGLYAYLERHFPSFGYHAEQSCK